MRRYNKTKLPISMNQDQALNQEAAEADLFMSEFMDSIGMGLKKGENSELTSLNVSELINTTEGEELELEGPNEAVLEHIMMDCDDFQLLEDEKRDNYA